MLTLQRLPSRHQANKTKLKPIDKLIYIGEFSNYYKELCEEFSNR